MKDELKQVAIVDSPQLARLLSKKIYKRYGITTQWSDSSDSIKCTVNLVDDGTLNYPTLEHVRGYAEGILETLEPLFSYT